MKSRKAKFITVLFLLFINTALIALIGCGEKTKSDELQSKIRVLWHVTTSEVVYKPTVADGAVYFKSRDKVYALDANDGKEIWSKPSTNRSECVVAVEEGLMFVSDNDDMASLDIKSGDKVWRFVPDEAPPDAGFYHNLKKGATTPVIEKGRLYFAGLDGSAYALDAKTGGKIWQSRTGEQIVGSVALSNDTIYMPTVKALYALDATTGSVKWRIPVPGEGLTRPVVEGGVVFFNDSNGILHALDAGTGNEFWSFRGRGPIVLGSPTVVDGIVYFGEKDRFYSVNAKTGEEIWSRGNQGGTPSTTPAVMANIVYVGTEDGWLYAIETESSEVKGKFKVGDAVYSSPTAVDDTIYIGGKDGLYALKYLNDS